MQPDGAWLNILLILSALPLLAVGMLLLRAGWFPRRDGDEPRCGACGYDVRADRGGVCPECGADLAAAKAVRSGKRPRRVGVGLAGMGLSLFGVACLTPQVRRPVLMFDWYALKPDAWVLRDLAAPAHPDRVRALGELRWRIRNGRLSPARQGELVEALLAAQARDARNVPEGFLTHLGARLADGTLTPDQRARFFRHLFLIDLRAPPRVTAGTSTSYEVVHRHRVPPNVRWYRRVEVASLSVDARELPDPGPNTYVGWIRAAGFKFTVPPLPPGRHVLRAEVRVALGSSVEALERVGEPVLYEAELPVEAAFEVLPGVP